MQKPIDTLRPALFLFSWLYGLVVFVRNKLYDWQVFRSAKFSIPIICVGNITVGGTGKTPHVEYLVKKLQGSYKIAVLSRGYGRKTKGFRYVTTADSADLVGDEPLQMKQKFPQVTFAVDESRTRGIQKLEQTGHNLIILDDAFQHRAVKPSKSVILIDYHRLPYKDSFLPSGNLRDGRYALKRANCVLITKCPKTIREEEKQWIIRKNKITAPVFFTHFEYGQLHSFNMQKNEISLQGKTVLLVTGIANPKPLVQYLKQKGSTIVPLSYSDHYDFAEKDIQKIREKFDEITEQNKLILTTEKDKVKLLPLLQKQEIVVEQFYYIPVKVVFENDAQSSAFKINLNLG